MTECRQCGHPIELADYALRWLAAFNRILARRHQPPLTEEEIALCQHCSRAWRCHEDEQALQRWHAELDEWRRRPKSGTGDGGLR